MPTPKKKKPKAPKKPAAEPRERGGEDDVERGPTSDVGGPRGIERGVGIETGEETP